MCEVAMNNSAATKVQYSRLSNRLAIANINHRNHSYIDTTAQI